MKNEFNFVDFELSKLTIAASVKMMTYNHKLYKIAEMKNCLHWEENGVEFISINCKQLGGPRL